MIGTGAAGTIVPNQAVASLASSGPALTAGSGSKQLRAEPGHRAGGNGRWRRSRWTRSNTAAAPADTLDGAFSVNDGGGFINGGFAGFTRSPPAARLAAGAVTLERPPGRDVQRNDHADPDGCARRRNRSSQPDHDGEAVVVPAPAVAGAEFAGYDPTAECPGRRVGPAGAQRFQRRGPSAATLSVTPAASGQATATGTVSGLTAGGTDAADILAGVDTSAAGSRTGSVTLNGSSVNSGGTAVALGSPPVVAVSANVYRLATGTIAPVSEYVHVADIGTVTLAISNTATADGFSENLLGTIAAVTSGLTIAAGGQTGEIAAGSTDTSSMRLGFSTAQAGSITATATVDLTSDGGTGAGGIDGLGTSALTPEAVPVTINVENYANPVFEDLSANGTFAGGGTVYTLNLGTISLNANPFTVNLGVLNSVTGPSDSVSGTLSAAGSSAFINSGLAAIGTLGAGQSDVAPSITLSTDTTGVFSETITLAGTASNAGGYSSVLPAETLTVTGSIAASGGGGTVAASPAVATILTPTPVALGNVHVGASASEPLSIENTATAGAANLDASALSETGDATSAGVFSGVAPGTSSSGVDVGINTGTAGAKSGTVVFGFVSDAGTLGTSALPSQTVTVSGSAYREAAATLLPLTQIVHVGDPGTIALPVSNSDPADGYSENLTATLIGVTGGLGIAASGPTPEIAAGQTNTTALALSFSTARAGTIAGSAAVALTLDGGTGAGSIDGLGTAALGSPAVPVDITVNNYADLVFTSTDSLSATGVDAYALDLGTAVQGAVVLSAALDLGNDATGPADWLNGTWSVSGASAFANAGLAAFSDLNAGGSLTADNILLSTGQLGVFSETITLTPTDANSGGYNGALAQRNITVTGTIVAPTGSGTGDVHMVTFDGLHYDFQAVGDYVLTRSTAPGNSFQIQIETAADPSIAAVSLTTEAAARVGSDVVTFGIGQSGVVWVDGAPDTALSVGSPQQLSGGVLRELSSTEFRVSWSTGETLTVTDAVTCLNDEVSLPANDGAGSVQGLLGSDSGQANDFQLANGTVLRQPLSASEITGEFASAWQVTPTGSLLGNTPMQFIYEQGGQSVLQATAAGQVLSAGAADVLSDTDGLGATFQGSLAALTNEVIAGFSVRDVIDVSDLKSAAASVLYTGSGSAGALQLSDGMHGGEIQLTGNLSGSIHVTSDGHGGSLIALG